MTFNPFLAVLLQTLFLSVDFYQWRKPIQNIVQLVFFILKSPSGLF